MKSAIAVGTIVALCAFVIAFWPSSTDAPTENTIGPLANVVLPDTFSETAQIGKRAFDAACADCHGANAAGRDGIAPPLVHVIYEPGHHGDESFYRAASGGVRAHHWPFGDMPAVSGITRSDVSMIIAYVRELQRANGIN